MVLSGALVRVVVVVKLIWLCGCQRPLPIYLGVPTADAAAVIQARQACIRTVSGVGTVHINDGSGARAVLDGVLLIRFPDAVRLRAWKLGRAVFDVTVTEAGVWAELPCGGGGSESDLGSVDFEQLAGAFDLLGPAFFDNAVPVSDHDDILLLAGAAMDCSDVLCQVHRPTLTPTRFTVRCGGDRATGVVELSHYVAVGPTIWPSRLRFKQADHVIEVRLHTVEINGDLPPTAFKPPSRARRLN
jgi:hypothetical protein